MINADLIGKLASVHTVDPGVIEKDYILSKALSSFAVVSASSPALIFKGGTALKKLYYPNWRYSEYLDFTSNIQLNQQEITMLFEQLANHVTEFYGVSMRVAEYSQYPKGNTDPLSAQLKLGFDGPLHKTSGMKNNIRVDIAFNEVVIGEPEYRQMFREYPDDSDTELVVYPLEEIVAEKLRSILQRGKSRDYYDVWLLLGSHKTDFSFDRTREILIAKCKHKEISKPVVTDFFEARRIDEAAQFWERGLAHQLPDLPEMSDVLEELRPTIGQLLQDPLMR